MKARMIQLVGAVALALGAVGLLLATMSAQAAAPDAAPVIWTDDFNSDSLNDPWRWIRETPSHWSLTARPGFLRLTTQQTFSNINNLLVQDVPSGDYEIQIRLIFTPTENFQIAGLLIYQDDGNWLTLGRAFCDLPPPMCVNNGLYFDRVEGGDLVGSNYAMTTPVQEETYLRLQRQGAIYTGSVSFDGSAWTPVGVHTATIRPTKIGLKCSNQIQGAGEIPADFDFFTLIDDSSRLFLPLTFKEGNE